LITCEPECQSLCVW